MSVVIPTYNRAAMLREAMDSVRAQTYRPIELVVLDDGSTDDTGAVVEAWRQQGAAEEGFAVRYVRQENAGLPAARNAGLAASRGAYVQFLDSDDFLHPDRFRRILEVAARVRGFQVAVTGYEIVNDIKRRLVRREPIELTAPDRIERCIRRPLWAASPLYARGFPRDVGLFDERLRYGEDWEFGIRVAIACAPERCAVLREPLATYRVHGGPRIMTARRRREEIEALFSAAAADLAGAGSPRHYDLLAGGLALWFLRHGERAYLRLAVRLPCSTAYRAGLMAFLLLSVAFDVHGLVRAWRGARRLMARLAGTAGVPPRCRDQRAEAWRVGW